MKAKLYTLPYCPRCAYAKKIAQSFGKQHGITIEEIDIIKHISDNKNDKIKMVPALSSGKSRIQGIWLSKKKIEAFLQQFI